MVEHISPARSKVVFKTLNENLSDTKVWVYMFKPGTGGEWTPLYCFTETEILPNDIPALNYSPWLSPKIHFTQRVVCVRQTTDQETDPPGIASEEAIDSGVIDGTLIVDHDKFKWRRDGKTVKEMTFQSDDERVEVLKMYFGIELDSEDREAILGTSAAIPNTS